MVRLVVRTGDFQDDDKKGDEKGSHEKRDDLDSVSI